MEIGAKSRNALTVKSGVQQHKYHTEMCDCWNVWHLWLCCLKCKVDFLKPSTSVVQKWLTPLKPRPPAFALALCAFRSRFGSASFQSNDLAPKCDEWSARVSSAFPLQAPAPSPAPQSISGGNPACRKLPPGQGFFSSPSALPLS